jgi:hypothetical protein
MLNFCGIVAAFLKMETGRNFSMSGINSGQAKQKNMCVYGHPTDPIFQPPTLTFY